MDPNYAARLLRQATTDPQCITRKKKFWKIDFFERYLRRAEKLIWETPEEALRFLEPAPAFSARIADTNPCENGADFLILGHSHLGNAYRKLSYHDAASREFTTAGTFRDRASPEALATYLQLYTSLCIAIHEPLAFDLLAEAITIHKRGTLVRRHRLGECLILRGVAYDVFGQPDRTLGDFTAALNHLSIAERPISYYRALHNLAVYAVRHGSHDDVREALDNLAPARLLLRAQRRHKYAKLQMRHLTALLDFRLGHHASAEITFGEVAATFHRRKLPFEVGLVQLDLARLYLHQGRRENLRTLVRDTARLFRELGNDERAEKAHRIWREAFQETVTELHLLDTRAQFFDQKQPIAG